MPLGCGPRRLGRRARRVRDQADPLDDVTPEPIAYMRAQGLHLVTRSQRAALRADRRQGAAVRTLMRDFRISKATVYRYLAETHPDQAVAADELP